MKPSLTIVFSEAGSSAKRTTSIERKKRHLLGGAHFHDSDRRFSSVSPFVQPLSSDQSADPDRSPYRLSSLSTDNEANLAAPARR
jgi:hypothetical protein